MSDIEEKKKKQQKIREEESEAEAEPEKDDEIYCGYVKKKKEKIEPTPRTRRAESLIVFVDNEETKFPFRFTPGTRSWLMFTDDLKRLREVSQRQRVSLTYEQKFGENCFKLHLKENPTKHLKSMSGVTRTRSHSWSM